MRPIFARVKNPKFNYCQANGVTYTGYQVRLHWKILRLGIIAASLALGAGCGGITASHSISPASFFLPGLLKADPPPANPDADFPADEPVKELAQS